MTIDIDKLEALAKAATQEPWIAVPDEFDESDIRVTTEIRESPLKRKVEIAKVETGWKEPFGSEQQTNLDFILKTDPAAILALITRLREAEQREQALAAHVERMSDIIRRVHRRGVDVPQWLNAHLVAWQQDNPTGNLARLKAQWQAEGAMAVRHLTQGDDWEDEDLRAVIDDYVAGLCRQAEGGGT